VLPVPVGVTDSVVQLVSNLGGVVSSARVGLVCIIVCRRSPVSAMLAHTCGWLSGGEGGR
jgi:hypothetical protein